MKEYKVILTETIEHTLIVEANEESEIEDKVIDMLANGKVDFLKGKTVSTQMCIEK